MKHNIQAKIYKDIKGMTHAEELEYYRRKAEELWKKFGKERPKVEKRKKETA
jgi:hypothetical protein